jgi:hexosaminidase
MFNLVLLPPPKQIMLRGGVTALADYLLIVIDHPRMLPMASRLRDEFVRAGVQWAICAASDALPAADIGVRLTVDPADTALPAQGYRLVIDAQAIHIIGGDDAGLFYGVCTLIQIIRQCGKSLPLLTISDQPDFPNRGVMLDISRDKVPTMDTLYHLIDLLAGWKINQVQLYTEHTFAYRAHRAVWEHASPMTGAEIMALDRYCRERFIELVPNQNSFGHLHRWLKHPAYRHLGETPEQDALTLAPGWVIPAPFSLSPAASGSLPFVEGLFDELLPHFSSRNFNVGCDETFDLGLGQSKGLVEAHGKGRVYLDFLKKILSAAQARGVTPMFWGDIVMEHPELVAELPDGVVGLVYGYEIDHPFDRDGERCAAANLPFYVCPGTSTWLSMFARTTKARQNIENAAVNGLKHGAIGLLNTDWGDHGHHQFLFASYPGYACGAASAWHAGASFDLPAALDLFAFEDTTRRMGALLCAMGDAYRVADDLRHFIGNTMVSALYRPLPELRESSWYGGANEGRGFSVDKFRQAMQVVEAAATPPPLPDTHIAAEFAWSRRLWLHGAERLLHAVDAPHARTAAELAGDLRGLVAEYPALWLRRNRPGGLHDSAAWLEKLIHEYEAIAGGATLTPTPP